MLASSQGSNCQGEHCFPWRASTLLASSLLLASASFAPVMSQWCQQFPRRFWRVTGSGVSFLRRRRAAGGASMWSHSLTPSMVRSFLTGFSGARFGAVACQHTNSSATSSTWSTSSCSA
ncbi:hypothetical protein PVAP13_5NG219462 [Panicum virgatum]|uniref:Secreted protein n=1 Tax=Panicum virgatum TaxID=38727 RepID=A0A8T0RPU0_PANVG|nr:hypothetical protein PVAP13_5NG219462 [Panicum virgatum]